MGLWDPRTFNVAYPEPRNGVDPYNYGYDTAGAPPFSGLGLDLSQYVPDPCVRIPRPAGCKIRGYTIVGTSRADVDLLRRYGSLRIDGWVREPGVSGQSGIYGLLSVGSFKFAVRSDVLVRDGLAAVTEPGLQALLRTTPADAAAERTRIEESQRASLAAQRQADQRIETKYSLTNLFKGEWEGLSSTAKTVSILTLAGLAGGVYLLFKYANVRPEVDVGVGPVRLRSR